MKMLQMKYVCEICHSRSGKHQCKTFLTHTLIISDILMYYQAYEYALVVGVRNAIDIS